MQNLQKITASLTLALMLLNLSLSASIGPIHIYNKETEFRTSNAVIDSIGSKVVLNSEQIAQTGANTFLELLASIPSINLFNATGNVASVFLRGTQSHHSVLIIDGVRLMDNSTPEGTANLNALSLSQIERVEIVKGPYSSLYGSGAIGGVIQVFTKKVKKNSASISTSYGSNNTKNSKILLTAKDKFISVSAGFNTYSTDGFNAHKMDTDDNNPNYTSDLDGKKKDSKNIAFSYQVNNKLKLKLKHLNSKTLEDYDDLFTPLFHNKTVETNFYKQDYQIDYQHSKKWDSKISLSKISQKRQTYTNGIVMTSEFDSLNEIQTDVFTWLSDIKFDDKTLLTLGYEKVQDNVLSASSDNKKLSNRDIFFQYQKNINNEVDLAVGYRETQHQEFGLHSTYNIGFNIKVSENFKVSVAMGSAFKAPVVDQLYDQSFTIGNPDLKPEKSDNIETSIDYKSAFGKLFVSIYNTTITNDIAYINGTAPSYKGTYENSDNKVNSKGVDLSFKFNPFYKINIAAYYYYNNAQENGSSEQLNRRPKKTSKWTIDRKFTNTNVHLELINKGSYRDGSNDMPGYQLINLSSHYQLNENWQINAKVNNIADTKYEVAKDYFQDGLNYHLGIKYDF